MLPQQLTQWLDTAAAQLRCRRAVPAVRGELETHMAEQYEAYRKEGLPPAAAAARCAAQMGDPVEVGSRLDAVHRPRPAWGPLLAVAVLILAGGVLELLPGTESARPLPWGLLAVRCLPALAVLFAAYFLLDPARLARLGPWLYAVFCAGLALFSLFAAPVNGVRRWLLLPGLTLSGESLAVLFLPLYAAMLYRVRGRGRRGVVQAWLLAAPALLFCAAMPAMGTLLAVGLCCLVLQLLCCGCGWFGPRRWGCAAFALGTVPGGALLLVLAPGGVRIDRVLAHVENLLHPLADPAGAGYAQTLYTLLRTGTRWLGRGLPPGQTAAALGLPAGQAFDASGSLAQANQLVYIGWCWGAAFALALALAVGAALVLLWRAAVRVRNAQGRLTALCCAVAFTVQYALCLLYTVGWWPAEAALPLIGGTDSLLCTQALLAGLLLAAFRLDRVTGGESRTACGARRAGRGLWHYEEGVLSFYFR